MEGPVTVRFVMWMSLMLAAGGGCQSEPTVSGGTADAGAPPAVACSFPTGWASMSTTGEPRTRIDPVMAWTGQELLVVGGWRDNDEPPGPGGRYHRGRDEWRPLPEPPADVGSAPTGVWTGSHLILWGGFRKGVGPLGGGAAYDPVSGQWKSLPTTGGPSPRSGHSAVWTGKEMLIWGGLDQSVALLHDGAAYDPVTERWRPMSAAGAPTPRMDPGALWTGAELIVWGGRASNAEQSPVNTGGRYDPVADLWSTTSMEGAPSPRAYHSMVWTGEEMIVWGGLTDGPVAFGDGARYHPGRDRWTTVSSTAAPSARFYHTAVWTGAEMLVYGGPDDRALWRYRPDADLWSSYATATSPPARHWHTATWTGCEMLVWGGPLLTPGVAFHP